MELKRSGTQPSRKGPADWLRKNHHFQCPSGFPGWVRQRKEGLCYETPFPVRYPPSVLPNRVCYRRLYGQLVSKAPFPAP